jgi:TFIIF-interacting CTD phosphatase-like protein
MSAVETRRRRYPKELGEPIELSMSRDGVKGDYGLILRPGVKHLLTVLRQKYQVVLWSFGVGSYINECLQKTGLANIFSQSLVITREKMDSMNTDLKDLYLLSKLSPLNEIVIADDSNEMFGILNPFNCIDVPTYNYLDSSDNLLEILPYIIDFHFMNILSKTTEEQLVSLRQGIIRYLSRHHKLSYD